MSKPLTPAEAIAAAKPVPEFVTEAVNAALAKKIRPDGTATLTQDDVAREIRAGSLDKKTMSVPKMDGLGWFGFARVFREAGWEVRETGATFEFVPGKKEVGDGDGDPSGK